MEEGSCQALGRSRACPTARPAAWCPARRVHWPHLWHTETERLPMKDSSPQTLHSSLECYFSFQSAKKDRNSTCVKHPLSAAQYLHWFLTGKRITLKTSFLVSGSMDSHSSCLPEFPPLSLLCHAKRVNTDNVFKQMWTKILTSGPAICLLSAHFLHTCKQPQWVQPAIVWHLIMHTLTELHKTNSSYSEKLDIFIGTSLWKNISVAIIWQRFQ